MARVLCRFAEPLYAGVELSSRFSVLKLRGFEELFEREKLMGLLVGSRGWASSLENMAILSRTLFSDFSSLRQSLERRGTLKERL